MLQYYLKPLLIYFSLSPINFEFTSFTLFIFLVLLLFSFILSPIQFAFPPTLPQCLLNFLLFVDAICRLLLITRLCSVRAFMYKLFSQHVEHQHGTFKAPCIQNCQQQVRCLRKLQRAYKSSAASFLKKLNSEKPFKAVFRITNSPNLKTLPNSN